ncbi:unnamed protein product [Trifolium pratense]|uniref:Uncharacterized protein n=1 Tax=Trifolium pratense TaxID=57577 RepID=A0ACB0J399_TRIPR|nr:unnamed protein product [Trifolium pratense]
MMGRPPCCEKIGVKKGPWTPEEDIILVSYIQEHGPGNWRSVPNRSGLMRCSKSCRLRWTNYLRPGIKRGNFNDHEEKMIIHLQALLGNRWAAIASYLPQRTDNDIKNYWNTHLRKKLKKVQIQTGNDNEKEENTSPQVKGQWERRLQTDIHMAKQALCEALSLNTPKPILLAETNLTTENKTSPYASNTENIARLLEKWMKKPENSDEVVTTGSSSSEGGQKSQAFDSLLSFNSFNSVSVEDNINLTMDSCLFQYESKPKLDSQVPFMFLEKWLFDDGAPQCNEEDLINMSMEENSVGLF